MVLFVLFISLYIVLNFVLDYVFDSNNKGRMLAGNLFDPVVIHENKSNGGLDWDGAIIMALCLTIAFIFPALMYWFDKWERIATEEKLHNKNSK